LLPEERGRDANNVSRKTTHRPGDRNPARKACGARKRLRSTKPASPRLLQRRTNGRIDHRKAHYCQVGWDGSRAEITPTNYVVERIAGFSPQGPLESSIPLRNIRDKKTAPVTSNGYGGGHEVGEPKQTRRT